MSAKNWGRLQQLACDKDIIPSVGPRYIDDRVRPWNSANTKSRKQGAYYETQFKATIESDAALQEKRVGVVLLFCRTKIQITVTALPNAHRGRLASRREKVVGGRLQGQGADFHILENAPLPPCSSYINYTCTYILLYMVMYIT